MVLLLFTELFSDPESLVMAISPFGTRSSEVRSRSGQTRSNFEVGI